MLKHNIAHSTKKRPQYSYYVLRRHRFYSKFFYVSRLIFPWICPEKCKKSGNHDYNSFQNWNGAYIPRMSDLQYLFTEFLVVFLSRSQWVAADCNYQGVICNSSFKESWLGDLPHWKEYKGPRACSQKAPGQQRVHPVRQSTRIWLHELFFKISLSKR